jgi:hypothetical protein
VTCPKLDESGNHLPNAVEDISDKSKTADVSNIPVSAEPVSPPPISVGSPIHQKRHTTTSSPVRNYGLSSAHIIKQNQHKARISEEERLANTARKRRSNMLFGKGSLLLNRPRRAISIGPKTDNSELPELDVVGLIRVLDNPEDLEYFDQNKSATSETNEWSKQEAEKRKCLSTKLYWTLIGAVFLSFGALLAAATFIALQRMVLNRNQVYVKRYVR